jgi:branched-chain amino acid transport system permease protein
MRYIFKVSYVQDIRLFQHQGQVFSYGLLGAVLLMAPWLLPEYFVAQFSFIFIYSIIGLGLMLLSGYTGLFSLGHAAFLGIGAYTEAILQARGWPFPLSVTAAMLLAAVAGVIIGLPALRIRGIYLAIATLAFGFIVEEIITRWESVTAGNSGKQVAVIVLAGFKIDSEIKFYYVALAIVAVLTLGMLNLLRSPTGRAFVAIRDSEISAQSMGISLAYYKTLSFALSAACAGIAGALYAHKLRFITPDQFTFLQSIELLMMIVIGGAGSMHGAFFGAAFFIALPQLIVVLKDLLPTSIGQASGLQPTLFGLIMIGFVLFEPHGIYGRWLKIRTYFQLFPFYRRAMFKRQKMYLKSERMR